MVENEHLVKLDFGRHGSVTVPADVAMRFVSDQRVKDQIRSECHKAIRVVDVYIDANVGIEKTPVISA